MLELLWIKSLFDFAALLLGGLFLLYLKTRYPQPSLLVKGLMILLGCKIMIDLLGFVQYTSWLRVLIGLPGNLANWAVVLQLLYAPILYYSFRTTNKANLPSKTQYLWHGLPALLYLLGLFLYTSGVESNNRYFLLLVEGQFIVYALLSFTVMEGDTGLVKLLRKVLGGLVVWRALRLIEYLAWLHLQWIEEPTAWGLYILSEFVFLGTLSYWFFKVIQQPRLLQEGNQWILSASSKQRIKKRLQNLASKDKVYLDPLLSLNRLAKALQVPSHYLSQYLNRELKMTFNEWVNSHRIEECKRLIRDPDQSDRTIQSLMYAVGFNSKSTFHTAFKKSTGMTPTQYRKTRSLAE
ncbi:MAG: helix-turn-helix domain-containing protein [Saprospiraceae bacterium]|nr:helix-turn-helix domain-containing protein [Saprospiraceae bacterium]